MTLAEQMGYPANSKLVIASCDDLGSCHAANVGIYRSLREGWATTAGLMVPAPWAREASGRYRGGDVGVHLTLNADYRWVRWGPVVYAPSLLSGDGGFPATVNDLWEHADLAEVRNECRAQIERAIYWGFDVTHLDSHLGALTLRPEFFDVALDMAVEFDLPLRLPDAERQASVGFPFRKLAADEMVLGPDHTVSLGRDSSPATLERALAELSPGVTELSFRPADDTPELRALTDDWPSMVTQLQILRRDSGFPALAERLGVTMLGYREIRDLQRRLRSEAKRA